MQKTIVLVLFLLAGSLYASSPFIAASEAVKLHGKPNVVFVMADGDEIFNAGHIAGSMQMEAHGLQSSNETGILDCAPLYKCVPDAEKYIGERGIDNDTMVIAYDDYRGPNSTGVYHFMLLYGHKNVKILQGGFDAWKKAGGKVATGASALAKKPKTFKAKVDMSILATKDDTHKASDSILSTVSKGADKSKASYVIIDTRSLDEAIGVRKVDNVARGGHIPGATLLEWSQVAGEKEKTAFPSDLKAVQAKLNALGITKDKTIYSYCHVGAGRGSFYYVLLKDVLGYPNVKVYTGGWNEWGNDMDLPIRK